MEKVSHVTSRIRALRVRAGHTMESIAHAMGYKTASGYQRYENPALFREPCVSLKWVEKFGRAVVGRGTPPILPEEVIDLAKLPFTFEEATSVLASGSGEEMERVRVAMRGKPPRKPTQGQAVPVIDYVQAGHWGPITDPYEVGDGAEWIVPEKNISDVGFALVVRGNSMEPRFRDGDKIIIDPNMTPQPGYFVVAKLDREDAATFKLYRPRGFDDNGVEIIDLVPLNENWPTLTISAKNPGRIIGVVVEHRSLSLT